MRWLGLLVLAFFVASLSGCKKEGVCVHADLCSGTPDGSCMPGAQFQPLDPGLKDNAFTSRFSQHCQKLGYTRCDSSGTCSKD